MGIFDIFTGQPVKEAAGQNRATLQSAQGTIGNLADITRRYNEDATRQGFGGARQDLATGYGASTDAINQGAGQALGFLDQGQSGALGQLGQARSDLTANGGAYAPLSALATRYGQGAQLYNDALGTAGPEGNARAVSAFQAGPGYDFALNQGIEALNRRANSAGMLGSGNAGRDAITFGTGLANQEYGNWLNRLAGQQQAELTATGQAAQGNQANNTTLANLGVTGANLLNQGGVNRAGVATGQGSALADLARTYYGGQANLDTGEAGALTNNMNNTSGWMVNSQMGLSPQIGKTFMDEGQAAVNGSANLWNLGMQGAKALASGGFGLPGGNLGLGGIGDPSMWNMSLPKGSLTGV